jgi:hypothetical protein
MPTIQNAFGNILRKGVQMIFGGDAPGDLYYTVEREDEADVFELERLPLGAQNTVLVAGADRPEWQAAPPATISDGSVTFAKIQDIPSGTVIGRVDAGAGVSSALTAGDLSTLLTLGDASQVDVTDLPGLLGLGTASQVNTGTTNGTVPLIVTGDKLPTSVVPFIPMPTNTVASTPVNMVVGGAVNFNRATEPSLAVAILPTSFAVGDEVMVYGRCQGFFRISQNAGQSIIFNDDITTSGTGGYIESRDPNSAIRLKAISTTIMQVVSAVGSGFEVV